MFLSDSDHRTVVIAKYAGLSISEILSVYIKWCKKQTNKKQNKNQPAAVLWMQMPCWREGSKKMTRLVPGNRKAMVTWMSYLSDCGEQKSALEWTQGGWAITAEVHKGSHTCHQTIGIWGYRRHQLTKTTLLKIGKMLPGLYPILNWVSMHWFCHFDKDKFTRTRFGTWILPISSKLC